MTERHDAGHEIRRWIEKAEHDLLAAEHTIELAEQGLTDIVCFHCQQCAEKYLKALLVFLHTHFPKTHDLRILMELVPARISLGLNPSNVVPLNRYTIEGRYPGDWEPITAEEAQEAIEMARKVRDAVRSRLPKGMLTGF